MDVPSPKTKFAVNGRMCSSMTNSYVSGAESSLFFLYRYLSFGPAKKDNSYGPCLMKLYPYYKGMSKE